MRTAPHSEHATDLPLNAGSFCRSATKPTNNSEMRGIPIRRAAFTVLEVLLALSIAIALLIVAIHFYRQAAEMRTQLLAESSRVAEARQILDRMTSDLRTAFPEARQNFQGSSNAMRFVRSEILPAAAWKAPSAFAPDGGLRLVTYSVSMGNDGTNKVMNGWSRTETGIFTAPPHPTSTNATNEVTTTSTSSSETTATNTVKKVVEPLSSQIRYVRYRYWEGSRWVEQWTATTLPGGVEVSFGFDPLPEGEPFDEYPYELFRRVIALPGGTPGVSELDLLGKRAEPAILTVKNR